MTKNISPALKGLITGIVMLCLAIALYYTNQPGDSPYQYIAYFIYAAGIVWTLLDYRKSPAFTGKFGDLFGQGFRCFIVITLIMVVFTGIFSKMHPEFAEQAANSYKEQMIKEKQKDKTLPEIESEAEMLKKHFTTSLVFASVFGYLIIGAVVTVGASALLIPRKQ
jgi:hypothetical protein